MLKKIRAWWWRKRNPIRYKQLTKLAEKELKKLKIEHKKFKRLEKLHKQQTIFLDKKIDRLKFRNLLEREHIEAAPLKCQDGTGEYYAVFVSLPGFYGSLSTAQEAARKKLVMAGIRYVIEGGGRPEC